MGRPPLAAGAHGRIKVTELGPDRFRARVFYRDYNGTRYEVSRLGRSAGAAHTAVTEALRDFSAPTQDDISSVTKIRTLAEHWSAQLDDADLKEGTLRLYRFALDSYVVPAVGDLRLRELTVQRLDRSLIAIRREHGAGAAKSARSVLSGMLGYAVRYGALGTNLARDTSPISRKAAKPVRALTHEETAELAAALAADNRANDLDLPDLVDWMLGTGMRIGETCAVRRKVIRDGVVEVNATVVRLDRKRGLTIQERPKSAAGHRKLPLSPSLLAMLERRSADESRADGPHGVVFASPRGKLRDPNNTSGDLREVLDRVGFEWVSSHVFRKTVATRLDEAGYTSREIADILGHEKPSLTQDVYMGRKVVSGRMARTLDRPSQPVCGD